MRTLKRDWQLYLLLALPLTYFIIFKYGPLWGIQIAFKDFNVFRGVSESPWIGLDAFKEVFHMDDFYKAFRNTIVLNLLDILFSFPIPIILAIFMNEVSRAWLKKGVQTIIYLPHFISWVIIGGISLQLFSTKSGIINNMITSMGFDAVPFLTEKYHWLFTYLAIGVWQSAGWGTIIYMAALAGINKELYEAAEVDGAGRFRKMWSITLPGLRSTIIVLLIIQIGNMMSIGFERPYVIGNDTVKDFSQVISTFVYSIGLKSGRFTIATAIGLFQAVIGMLFILSANFIAKKTTDESIL